jgi:P-type E1-E2 ATPase
MIDVAIPGFGRLALEHLVCDYNGTLARDGVLLDGVAAGLTALAAKLTVHIVTGDTFGTAQRSMQGLPCAVTLLPPEGQVQAKQAFVTRLGAAGVVALGNGRNDRLMLDAAALGIAVIGAEGLAADAMQASDIVVREIADAFELLKHPQRLVASLRV